MRLILGSCLLSFACSGSNVSSSVPVDGGALGDAPLTADASIEASPGDAPANDARANDAQTSDAPTVAPAPCGSSGVSCSLQQAVASRVLVVGASGEFAVDLDGDGQPENQLGNILGTLAAQGLNPQGVEDTAVTSGEVLVLLDEASVDPAYASDPGAAVGRVLQGKSQATPDFSGAGAFTIDGTATPGTYQGTIVASTFSSPDPATVTNPPVLKIAIAAPTLIAMPLYAAHLKIVNTNGKATSAQVNGAYRESDI